MQNYSGVAEALANSGAVAVIATDTVYGVVSRAQDSSAVANLYALKHREGKPGTLIAASIEQLEALGLKRRYLKAVEQFWPGAVSVIIPCADPALEYLHQGKMSLAVRIPEPVALRALLEVTGPLLTSSANHPKEPSATTIEEARNYFNDEVSAYFDGGDLSSHKPSTIIKIVDDAIEVVRVGAVEITQ
jgi:L-threonylcarbamoyladenylate synthase